MRILQVNKFHYNRGGADKYYLSLIKALEQKGHQVAAFSMYHPKNIASPYYRYFVSRLSFNEGGLRNALKTPGRMIYSFEAKRKFKKLVLDFKPEIIHIHNIYHQISPSILDIAARFKIPVVMHLHDYKLICPNYQLFVNGKVCDACRPNKYFWCYRKKCFKNSRIKSALAVLEMYIHHSLLKIYKKNITEFIAPSTFMKQKLVDFGWNSEKINIVINPFDAEMSIAKGEEAKQEEEYLLYFGRLGQEKGLEILIQAAALTKSHLKFVGIGTEEDKLKKLAEKLKVQAEFLGFKNGPELKYIILRSKAIIIPSIWFENMSLSLLEALNLGKIVIASNIGGIPEIIKHNENGLLFEPGNVHDLADKINSLGRLDIELIKQNAKESVRDLNAENNLQQVEAIYQKILNK
jgi:glycosyltransferase involved in cell wall biosynthesis